MRLDTVVEAVINSIANLHDDWYDLPEQNIEAVPGDNDVEQSLSHVRRNNVLSEELRKSKEKHIVETIRSFIRYVYYSHSLLLKSAGFTSGTICPYDLDPAGIKKQLRGIMDQCRRIRDEPHMFPSSLIKAKFLTSVTVLAEAMMSIEQMRTKLLEFKQQAYSPVIDMYQPFSSSVSQSSVVYPMPPFLPDKFNGKHPWNNWLENSAKSAAGWIAIQQKIPKAGEKLMRKIVLMYDVVQEQFEEEAEPEEETKNNDEIPAPGDSFRHMTWSGFCTFPSYNLGFRSGHRKEYDIDGIVTLENLSSILCALYQGSGMEIGTDNCPFFRFAMAYTKR